MAFTNHEPFFHYRYEGLGVKEIRQYLDEKHPEVYHLLPEPSLELPKVSQAVARKCLRYSSLRRIQLVGQRLAGCKTHEGSRQRRLDDPDGPRSEESL